MQILTFKFNICFFKENPMISGIPSKPKKIGNYQICEMIGKGAIGSVYKGLSTENGSTVAIK